MKSFFLACAFVALLLGTSGAALVSAKPTPELPVKSYVVGQFLVASQQLKDQYFAKTVIYMMVHTEQGAIGVIVNRLAGTTSYKKLLSALGIKTRVKKKLDVYFGGPVEIGRGLILHSPDYKGTSTLTLTEGLAVSIGPDVLQALVQGKGPKQSRLMLGYAGWGAGQLDQEMAHGDWLVAPADPALIFSVEPEKIWEKALVHAGIRL